MRHFATYMVLLLMAAHSALPKGYMIVPEQGGGSFAIVVCTSAGARTINVDASGNKVDQEEHRPRASVCDFALAGSPVLVDSCDLGLETQAQYASVAFVLLREQFRADARSGAVSAHGPPAGDSDIV